MLLGVPIAFSVGIGVAFYLLTSSVPNIQLVQRIFTSLDQFPYLAILLFMLAGSLMESGEMSQRLIKLADKILGNIPGRLGVIGILSSMFFGALTGSGPGTTAAIGSALYEPMVERGYPKSFSIALLSAAGPLGILIPPSIFMVIFGYLTGTSIGKLFLAGFGVGTIFGIGMIVVAIFSAIRYKFEPKNTSFNSSSDYFKSLFEAFKDAIWALLMPLIILGGIYGGIFTPTEAAGIAVVYGFFVVTFIYKSMNMKKFIKLVLKAGEGTAVVMVVLSIASALSWIITTTGLTEQVANLFFTISNNPKIILLLINIVLILAGCVLDGISYAIILLPLISPIMNKMGIDPVHYGMIMTGSVAIGLITPPIGLNLFVGCNISHLSLDKIVKGILPFFAAMIICQLIITYVPFFSLFLVRLFY